MVPMRREALPQNPQGINDAWRDEKATARMPGLMVLGARWRAVDHKPA
jgi:hypothetical protein